MKSARLQHHITKAAQANNDAGFNTFSSAAGNGFALNVIPILTRRRKRYADNDKAGQQRPSIKAAMFAELPPGAYLGNIATPMPVPVRYHLELSTRMTTAVL